MSAETSKVPEDILDPSAWNEQTVLTVSVSPWYKASDGSRIRMVHLTQQNSVQWDEVRKDPKEPWDSAKAKTTAVIRKMLQAADMDVHGLAI